VIPNRPQRSGQVSAKVRQRSEDVEPLLPRAVADTFSLRNPARVIAFGAGLCLVLMRYGALHQIMAFLAGVNLRLLYLFGIPALVGVFLSGGVQRTFRGRPAYYWTAYLTWMGVAIPFSSWKGGSAGQVFAYARTEFIMLLAIAGLTITWRECKLTMHVIAWAAVISVAAARLFEGETYKARLGLEFGTMANPNDYAAHLLMVLPFLLWVVLSSRRLVVRLGAFLVLGAGMWMILRTASRGGALALALAILFFLWRGTAPQRAALLVFVPLMLTGLAVTMPGDVLQRLREFSTEAPASTDAANSSSDDDAVSAEAIGSAQGRQYALQKSLEYTITHPVFGVGPGQFATFEGGQSKEEGKHGAWRGTHNTFTQVSSECGIPALFFFVGGLISTYLLLNRAYLKARQRADCKDIQIAAFCILMGMVGFCTAATFLNFAYMFYQPALGGLAIAFDRAAELEFEVRSRAGQAS